MSKVLSHQKWYELWTELGAQTGESLGLFCRRCDEAKRRLVSEGTLHQDDTSNGRWVVHLEHALQRGDKVPDSFLAEVLDDDLACDRLAFPLLCKALKKRKEKHEGTRR